jgi:hypothetical protein
MAPLGCFFYINPYQSMQESHLNQPNAPIGQLDFDTDVTSIDNKDYRYALNIRNGYGAVQGVVTNVKGNDLVAYTLPAGNNVCIGTCEDKRGQSVLYFVFNSGGNHQILQYFPTKITIPNPYGTIEKVASGSVLNFSSNWLITHAELVNGELLYWTDAYTDENLIVGNPPRKINVKKGNIVGKLLEYEVYAGLPDQNQFIDAITNSVLLTITIFNRITNAVVATNVVGSTTLFAYANDPEGFLAFLVDNININLNAYLLADYCTCKMSVKVLSADNYLTITETNNNQPDFLFVSTNHYPFNLQEQHFDLLKYPPYFESVATYFGDNTITYNYVSRNMFQFNVRYWFDDGEKSKWSPISLIPLNIDIVGNMIEAFNAIKIDFTDSRLNDPNSLCIIRKVELAFRESNNDVFKSIKILEVCEIGINQQFIVFRNDQLFTTVESDDATVADGVQALALFDAVPILAGCLESSADAKGNTRIFVGSNLENYDPLDCIDMNFEVTVEPTDPCLCTIRGVVRVMTWQPTSGSPDTWALVPNVYGVAPIKVLNFKDRVLDGFVVYLAGTPYFAVSDSPNDGSGTGIFEIKNVPKGKYILRVASYKCRFDDSLGRIHNLANGLEWQRTSSPTREVAGSSLQPGGKRFERFIDLTGFAGGLFDLSTQPGFGTVDIINLTTLVNYTGGGFRSMITVEYYFLDNEGKIDSPDTNYFVRQSAIAAELQTIINNASITTASIDLQLEPIDFNGYGFALYSGIGANTLTFVHQILCADSPSTQRIFAPAAYTGGYYELFSNNLSNTPGVILNGGEFMLFNNDKIFTEQNKSSIQGRVFDTLGNPVANTLVVLEANTRWVKTNQFGYYSIVFYCQYNDNFRTPGFSRLFTTYLPDTCYDYPILNSNVLTNAGFFFVNIDFDTPFVGPNPTFTNGFVFGLPQSGPANNGAGRFLKSGGVYRVGLVYEDRGNRKNTVSESRTKLTIPFHTVIGSYSKPVAVWRIDHIPPIWATHYRIVRTRETTYARYLHTPAIKVRYVRIGNSVDTPIDTSFANGDATHILLGIGSNLESAQPTDPILWFYKTTDDFGYLAQLKDRVRLILNEQGVIATTGQILEFEITGQYLENDIYYVVIENATLLQEIKTGWLLELFTPKQNEEAVFYEVGETYVILNAGLPNRAHAGSIQDQIPGVQPASGQYKGGDTYWRIEDFAVNADFVTNYVLERQNLSWKFPSNNSDIGRPNIIDKDFFQQFYPDIIRFSELFLPGTLINGLSSFRLIDKQGIDQRCGILKRLIVVREAMLAVCQFKIQPIYVGKDNLLDLSGQSNIGRSDQILNLAVQLKEDYGTHNPESIVEDEGTVYGFDIYKGIAWRYSTNGLFPISDYKAVNYFNAKGQQLLPLPRQQTRVFGGFERFYKNYLVSFVPVGEIPGETIGFDEPKNGWCSFFSFIPEMYGKFGKKLVSFVNGALWLHDLDTVPRNNFYGVQHTSKVQFVSNLHTRATKLWYNIDIQADKLWFASELLIPPNDPYQAGMRSMLLANKFVNREGVWMADFLRDMNDTQAVFFNIPNTALREVTALLRGRPLRGEVLIVTLELATPGVAVLLKRADIEFVLSMDTKG